VVVLPWFARFSLELLNWWVLGGRAEHLSRQGLAAQPERDSGEDFD
jgi:hypothetical protein